MKVIIEKARSEDAKVLANLKIQTWHDTYHSILSPLILNSLLPEAETKGFQSLIQETSTKVLVARIRALVVGYCILGPVRPFHDIIQHTPSAYIGIKGELMALYVKRGYQRMRIGTQLLKAAKEHLILMQLTPFIVWVFSENIAGCTFYQRHGGSLIEEAIVSLNNEPYYDSVYKFQA